MLMLTLPFMVRDLIAEEVSYVYTIIFTMYISCLTHVYPLLQVTLISVAIDRAYSGSGLHGLPHVSDPRDDIVEVLIKCMEYNISGRMLTSPLQALLTSKDGCGSPGAVQE